MNMKSRFTVFILIQLLLAGINLHAQNPKFSGWGKNYFTINSYNGLTVTDALKVRIEKNGVLDIKPGWKISVRATATPLKNGKFFPVEELSLQPYLLSGASNDPGPLPAISQIGINASTFLQSNAEVFLIPSSPAHLYNKGTYNTYFDFQLQLNLTIRGGSYLNRLKDGSWPEYPVRLEFKLYDSGDALLGMFQIDNRIQVSNNLSGTPPVENNFLLQISNGAKSGMLEVKSIADYVNGASVSYPNGIIVSSNTDFQLKVKSMASNFTALSGATLPVEVVKVRLEPESGGTYEIIETSLSTTATKILSGATTNSQAKSYKLTYSTNANDDRLIQSKVDEYQATLTYEMAPK